LLGDTDGLLGYESSALKSQLTCKPNFAVELDVFVDGEGVDSCPLPADGTDPVDPVPEEILNEPRDRGSPDNDGKYHVGVDVNFAVSSVQTDVQYACSASMAEPALPDVFDSTGVKGAHFEIHYLPSDCDDADPGCVSGRWSFTSRRRGAPASGGKC